MTTEIYCKKCGELLFVNYIIGVTAPSGQRVKTKSDLSKKNVTAYIHHPGFNGLYCKQHGTDWWKNDIQEEEE